MPNPVSLFRGVMMQKTAASAALSLVAPTFGGITGVTPSIDSSFAVSWSAATGSFAAPAVYEVFVGLGSLSAAALFALNPVTRVRGVTTTRVFMLADAATYFVRGLTYTFGVRAVSASGASNGNTVVMTEVALASGNLPSEFNTYAASLAQTNTDLIARNAELIQRNSELVDGIADLQSKNADYLVLNVVLSDTQEKIDNSAGLIAATVL